MYDEPRFDTPKQRWERWQRRIRSGDPEALRAYNAMTPADQALLMTDFDNR